MSADVKTMEVKKTQQPAGGVSSKETTAQGAKNFLEDIKAEYSKISWTNPEELRLYTKLVVGATFIMGIGIYIVDLLIQGVLGSLSHIVQFLFG